MKTALIVLLAAAGAGSTPADAVVGGKLGTVQRGKYICEMPGDAASTRGVLTPEHDFEITTSSTYRTPAGEGTYLRTGDDVKITSGPKFGEHFVMKSERYLRLLDGKGAETGLRCVRRGSNP